jgi:hypothetical protein
MFSGSLFNFFLRQIGQIIAVALACGANAEEMEVRRHGGVLVVLGESERRQSHLHLLSQTVILSNCQTVKL